MQLPEKAGSAADYVKESASAGYDLCDCPFNLMYMDFSLSPMSLIISFSCSEICPLSSGKQALVDSKPSRNVA